MIKNRPRQQGFTLIELLVVIVIMATFLGSITLAFGRSESQRFISNAQKLQTWMEHLTTEAILSSTTWGAIIEESHAKALVWDGQQWLEAADIEALQLEGDLQISHLTEAKPNSDPDKLIPHFTILATGQILPASKLILSSNSDIAHISWLESNDITLEYPQQ